MRADLMENGEVIATIDKEEYLRNGDSVRIGERLYNIYDRTVETEYVRNASFYSVSRVTYKAVRL